VAQLVVLCLVRSWDPVERVARSLTTSDICSVPPIVNLVVYKDPEFPALSAARFGVTERVQ
jgi:hypothetical protein